MNKYSLPIVEFTEEEKNFRLEVREFLETEKAKGTFETNCDSWLSGYSREFTEKLGEKGWIGMTWPKKYGGGERTAIERYIVIEELLAIGAPVAGHWFADRQTGPLLLRYGTEEQKQFFLPKIAKGKLYFAIGLSEPNSGSDLASISTKAEKVDGGWLLNGSKIWTSGAHLADYMIVLCRTSPKDEKNRHKGMSQLIVDMKSEGITIRPIKYLTGEAHFNEVFFDNVFVPDENVVGTIGNGWKQSMAELAFERSGPERILSTYPILEEMFQKLLDDMNFDGEDEIIDLVAELINLRFMSIGVAEMLQKNVDVNLEAAIVKDLGTQFERKVAEVTRSVYPCIPSLTSGNRLERLLAQAILHGPGFTLRGGTNEILRGIIAKGLIA